MSKATGIADHVQSLDDWFCYLYLLSFSIVLSFILQALPLKKETKNGKNHLFVNLLLFGQRPLDIFQNSSYKIFDSK